MALSDRRIHAASRLPQPGKVKVNWRKRRGSPLADTFELMGERHSFPHVSMHWLQSRVERDGEHLIWQGTIQKNGSPQCRMAIKPYVYKTMTVRRLVWANSHPDEAMPDGHIAYNACRVYGCVSPSCVVAMTMSDVVKLVRPHLPLAHKANLSKARSKNSKVPDEAISEMRYGDKPTEHFVQEYGVNPSYVPQVRRGVLRRDYVPNPYSQLMKHG